MDSDIFKVNAYKHLGSDSDFDLIHNSPHILIKPKLSRKPAFIIGVCMGAAIAILVAVALNKIISGISIENNQKFRDHFPIWRGASYLVLYLWILGLDLLFY